MARARGGQRLQTEVLQQQQEEEEEEEEEEEAAFGFTLRLWQREIWPKRERKSHLIRSQTKHNLPFGESVLLPYSSFSNSPSFSGLLCRLASFNAMKSSA
jgi:hypothetical protein